MVAETRLSADRLIMPHFVVPAEHAVDPIPSMPGIARYGFQDLLSRVELDCKLGIRTVLLFGLPAPGSKSPSGAAAADTQGAVPTAVRLLKQAFGSDLLVMTDVCLCAYTDHGHCGLVERGEVVNDPSLAALSRVALCHARAGADFVAPSDMMDGRVAAIRALLDREGWQQVGILSYAIKYASAYYGPFRAAADSAPGFGDRRTYQMDPRNAREALREARLDEKEGADLLMVKPALAYLDVIHRVRRHTDLPLAAYNVSGEYAAVKAAAQCGWLDLARVVHENLTAMARAGADLILTYHAREALEGGWL
jgi:porphobilinogen synthase